jgi:hypothetical protein
LEPVAGGLGENSIKIFASVSTDVGGRQPEISALTNSSGKTRLKTRLEKKVDSVKAASG